MNVARVEGYIRLMLTGTDRCSGQKIGSESGETNRYRHDTPPLIVVQIKLSKNKEREGGRERSKLSV